MEKEKIVKRPNFAKRSGKMYRDSFIIFHF
jgi:hypothetical protein